MSDCHPKRYARKVEAEQPRRIYNPLLTGVTTEELIALFHEINDYYQGKEVGGYTLVDYLLRDYNSAAILYR